MNRTKQQIRNYLSAGSPVIFVIYASLASFLTYSCMYAYRKPFTAAAFAGYSLWGTDLKIWLITAQVIGYTMSKFIGIRFVSELTSQRRAVSTLVLIGFAELGLLLFYKLPVPYKVLGMFLNGLPLGIIWGIVFSYLEGRKLTELLGAALSASFILSSGILKSIGRWLINVHGVSEFSMPFITGLIFAIPLVICVFLLDSVPRPSSEDEQYRTKREPMDRSQRIAFLNKFLVGIVLLIIAYMFLTFFRELRDNFAYEIWTSLGYTGEAIYTTAEVPVTLFTLISLAMLTFIKSNIKAFTYIQVFILASFLIILISVFLFSQQFISGKYFMITVGIGLYMGYVPFNAFLFERLISAFRYKSNIGFVMYVCDAFGYLASLSVVFIKNFFSPQISWLNFLLLSGTWFSLLGVLLMILSIIYFTLKYKRDNV